MNQHKFDLCILGKQAIDDDYVQTGQILASCMGIPAATFCSEIVFTDDNAEATILREVDFGLQRLKISLPAVFTCDLRLNQPRFANVKSILKAKKKKVEVLQLDDLGIDVAPRITIESVQAPSERAGGVLVESVDELVDKLKNEARVI